MCYLFPEQREMRVVRGEAEHHEVSVEAVEAVPHVRVVARLAAAVADILHDLVLAFPRGLVARLLFNVGKLHFKLPK